MKHTHRLVTKGNIDGIVSSLLLKELDLISDVLFVEEKEIKTGKIPLNKNDITVNLPFVKGVYQAFDYHDSHDISDFTINENHIIDTTYKTASEIILSHYHDDFTAYETMQRFVDCAIKESHETLTTKDRLYIYDQYKKLFENTLIEA